MNEKISFKFAGITILCLMLMLPVFSLVHEYGHVIICWMDGREYLVGFTGFGAWTSCDGKFEDPTMFRLAGGFLSASLALIVFSAIRTKAVGKYKPIAIAIVTIAVVEYVNMIQETFFNDFHMSFGSAVSGMLLLGLTVFFVFRHSPRRLVRA